MRSTTLLAALAALVVAAAQPAAARQTPVPAADVLRLPELLDRVATRNPRLRAVEAGAAAAATRVAEASTLPDPVLQLGVMNFGIPDLNTDMPTSMAPSVQLVQRVPFPGKLGLRGEMAAAAHGMADATAREAWWEVRQSASALFYDLYSLDRRIGVMRGTLALLRDFRTIATSMYSAGGGRQADVLRADVEVARMDGEIRRMLATRSALAARLNGVLDLPASTPVPTPVLPPLPATVPGPDTLRAWAEASRPLLAHARLDVDRARAQVDLAGREVWPDLTLGVTYGQRDRGLGVERMGSAVLGFSLPVHARKRQLAARDEAGALRRMADARLGAAQAEVDARIGELLAELERVRSLLSLYREEVLPVARATVESALSSYRVGAVDFMSLVDAEMTVNRYEAELHDLEAQYGKAVAGLESTVGRLLPPAATLLAEPADDGARDPEEVR